MKRALFVGSFDPFTYGHLNILKRASRMFDEVVVAIGTNTSKNTLFSTDEKYETILNIVTTEKLDNVQVLVYESELTVHLAERVEASFIIRGLRSVADFEYESEIAAMNKAQNPKIESVFLMSDESYRMISSSLIKEIARFGGDVSNLVPEIVAQAMKKKYMK